MGLEPGAWAIQLFKASMESRGWVDKIRKDLDANAMGDIGLAFGALDRLLARFREELLNLNYILPTYADAARALTSLREKLLLAIEVRNLHPALKADDYYALDKHRQILADQIKGHNERTKHFTVPPLPPA